MESKEGDWRRPEMIEREITCSGCQGPAKQISYKFGRMALTTKICPNCSPRGEDSVTMMQGNNQN